jgi:hypothetical protein
MALTVGEQKLMAFDGLMTWARGVVDQSNRLSQALVAEIQFMEQAAAAMGRRDDVQWAKLKSTFYVERMFFCYAAGKFFEYRDWVVELGLLETGIFADVDKFADDARAMRNFNEHAIEYFKGAGRFPEEWDANLKQFNSDPTGTSSTNIGGRLDWVEVGKAVESLIPTIPNKSSEIYVEIDTARNARRL